MILNVDKKWPVFSWILALLLVFPLVAIVYQSLLDDQQVFAHLWDTVLTDYILNTIILVLGVAFASLVIGIPAAWLTAMCEFSGRKTFQWALLLPLAMPSYLIAYVYTDILEYAGPIQHFLRASFGWQSRADYWFFDVRSITGAGIMLTLVLYPYVYLLARTAFLEQSTNLIQSSRMLGCSPWQSFRKLSLPLARPAIAVAVALIAMETLADFATVHYFAVNTLTTAVYDTWLGYGSLGAAAKLSSLMLFIIFFLISLERLGRSKQKQFQKNTGREGGQLYHLSGGLKYLAIAFCSTLFFVAFLFPFLVLCSYAFEYFEQSWNQDFIQYSLNSLLIASVVSGLCVFFALVLAFYKRLSGTSKSAVPARLATMGYALPGTVLAIGVLIPLTTLDHQINAAFEFFELRAPGLILSGSIIAIVFAYIVRFSAIAVGSIESSLAKVTPSLDMVSVTLAIKPMRMLRKIHLPLVRKGCLAGALLVFIESMKELPAALLLRPFNFETLATYVYQYVSDEQLEQAALAAIVIVLVGLIPIIFLNRSLEQQHSQH